MVWVRFGFVSVRVVRIRVVRVRVVRVTVVRVGVLRVRVEVRVGVRIGVRQTPRTRGVGSAKGVSNVAFVPFLCLYCTEVGLGVGWGLG
jgi:hypothetical protein